MTAIKKDTLFWIGILTAIMFAFTSTIWTDWFALIVAYPVGLISLIIWLKIKPGKPRTKFIPVILIIGFAVSLMTFCNLVIYG